MKKVTVRSLAEADPKYAEALALRQKLRGKLGELEAEESRLFERIGKDTVSDGAESNAVAALLGDPLSEEADKDGPCARLRTLQAERNNIRRALEIADARLQAARFAASAVIMGEVQEAYGDRVRALAVALVKANEAHEELLSLIADLSAQDVVWSGVCEPMQATNIFGHRGGRISTWLHGAKRAGFIDLVPENFK